MAGKTLQGRQALPYRCGLQGQILGRIADQEKLGEQGDVSAQDARPAYRIARQRLVAGDVPDLGIGLNAGDGEGVGGHGRGSNALTVAWKLVSSRDRSRV